MPKPSDVSRFRAFLADRGHAPAWSDNVLWLALRLVERLRYSPDQPREANGRFGSGGGMLAADKGDGSGAAGAGPRGPDPRDKFKTPQEKHAYDLGKRLGQEHGGISKGERKEAIEKAGLQLDRHAEAFNAGAESGRKERETAVAQRAAAAEAKRLEPLTSRGQGPVTAAEYERDFTKNKDESTKAYFRRYAANLAARLQALRVPLTIDRRTGKSYTVSQSTESVYLHGKGSNLEIRISGHSAAGGKRHDPDRPARGAFYLRPLEGRGGRDRMAAQLTDKLLSIVRGYAK